MEDLGTITEFLDSLRRRSLRIRGTGALFWALAGATAWAIVIIVLAGHFAEQAITIRNVTLFVVILGLLAIGYFGFVRPRRQLRSNRNMAIVAGERVPDLASDLLSVVELAHQPRNASAELVNALVGATAQRVLPLDRRELIPASPLKIPALGAASLVGVLTGIVIFFPSLVAEGAKNLMASTSDLPFAGAELVNESLVADLEIELVYPEYSGKGVQILPGSSGDFRALPGTKVTLRGRAIYPAAKAAIVRDEGSFTEPDEGAPEQVQKELPATLEGDAVSLSFELKTPMRYRFILDNSGGGRKVEALPHEVELDPDLSPKVELYAPADELDVTDMKRVELAYLGEDDFGISSIELVWQDQEAPEPQRRALDMPAPGEMITDTEEIAAQRQNSSAQDKFLWDLAELDLRPGAKVAYWIEIKDNDTVSGPKVGRSKSFMLRIYSPREKHEAMVDREYQLFERMIIVLAGRLETSSEDIDRLRRLNKESAAIVVELGTIMAALKEDEMTDKALVEALNGIRKRMESLNKNEYRLLARMRGEAAKGEIRAESFRNMDKQRTSMIAQLEDDVLLLADWLDRQNLENLAAIADEIKDHQERLKKLLDEYAKTGDESLLKEIEREMRAMERKAMELASKRRKISEDVLDRFMNKQAMQDQMENKSCMDEVRSLLAAGQAQEAADKMKECAEEQNKFFDALDQSLGGLRGERFSAQEKKFNEMLDKLSDLAQDQQDIANKAEELYERYKEKADEAVKGRLDEARKAAKDKLKDLEKKLNSIPDKGLSEFSKDEKDAAKDQLEAMKKDIKEGEMTEALDKAQQIESSLEMMEVETDSEMESLASPPKSMAKAAEGIGEASQSAQELIESLKEAMPSPDSIMNQADKKALDKLRKRQEANRKRSEKLQQETKNSEAELPGDVSEQLQKSLEQAGKQMQDAEKRMRGKDPAGSRTESKEAATTLEQAKKNAQQAARKKQGGQKGQRGLRDEPIRIPGADEYRAPKEFREELLEAMKKEKPPEGFQDMVRRYYEELVR